MSEITPSVTMVPVVCLHVQWLDKNMEPMGKVLVTIGGFPADPFALSLLSALLCSSRVDSLFCWTCLVPTGSAWWRSLWAAQKCRTQQFISAADKLVSPNKSKYMTLACQIDDSVKINTNQFKPNPRYLIFPWLGYYTCHLFVMLCGWNIFIFLPRRHHSRILLLSRNKWI